MDKQSAVKLLNETFKRDFDINCYISFIKELFNHFDIKLKEYQPETQYNEYIDRYCSLGHFTDASRKIIEILTVKLKRTSSRDRARTMQRNFVAQYLRTYGKHAALVAFYGDDEDWRFSFVKMEYTLVQDEKGKVKPEEELTPAKRYSFLVGKNEPNHTCEQQFVGLLMEDKKDPLIDEIENAFSIEKVSKVFFEEYKKLYWALEDSLREIISKDSIISAEFEDKNISTVDFSKKLLGQIVFIYFLQKKGWLGVKVNEQWGTGPRDFLRRLFGDSKRGIKPLVPYNNFFNDILEPLFYEALATDRAADNHYYRLFNCKIPFLNGGLFEPINEYDWTGTEIKLDDTIFEGIFDTFDRFNFTVKEDEPLEKEVAVDPEMLGKVFENLLEVKDRKSKGAFYTPREIVHYMCQQSLINYIETNTTILREDIEKFVQRGDLALDQIIKAQAQKTKYQGKLFGVDTKALLPKSIEDNYEVLDKLLKEIKVVDPAVGSGAFPVGMLNEIVKARSILSVFFKEERKNYDLKREIIENCLYGVDIEPSAVEIAKLRFWLSLIVDEDNIENIKPLPNLDHKIMCGNSLLEEFEGVKLFDEKLLGQVPKDNSLEIKQIDDKIAVLNKEKGEIARGKKGRSIKVVEREIKRLEAKKESIREGKDDSERNSTLDESFRIKESQKKLAELKRMQKEYFNEQNRGLKKQLREKIDKIEWELIKETLKEQGNSEAMQKLEQYRKNKAKPFFLWKLYFAEVFQRENPGFDVVLGNPPYVRVQTIDNDVKDAYTRSYDSARGKYDLYVLFTEKGINLANQNGTMTYIMPNKFTNTHYGTEIRRIILEKTMLREYIDFNDQGVFEGATNYPCIIILQKKSGENIIHYSNIKRISSSLTTSLHISKKEESFSNEDLTYFRIKQKISSDEYWIFLNTEISAVMTKLSSDKYVNFSTVRNKIYEGLITGNNKIYFIDEEVIKKYGLERELIKRLPKGKNLEKYYLHLDDYYVIYPYVEKDGKTQLVKMDDYPNIRKYFEMHKADLIKREYLIKSGKEWYEIWNPRTIDVFSTRKIITPNLSKTNKFCLDENASPKNYVCIDHDCYGIILQDDSLENYKYFLGVLNNPIIKFVIQKISPMFSGGYYKYHTQYLDKLPIPANQDEIIKKKIVVIVDNILELTGSSDYADNPDIQEKVKKLRKEVDNLVYKMYKLTPEEIKIIEKA